MMLKRLVCLAAFLGAPAGAWADAQVVNPPYEAPRVVFDFFFDHPAKINAALFWLRALVNPLAEAPYDISPDAMSVKVVIHGTEIAAVAKKNYPQYWEAVERMRYYAGLGVEFKVCALAAHDYGYSAADLQDFVQVVPSAITELVHWQMKGHALITPVVTEKRISVEDIR